MQFGCSVAGFRVVEVPQIQIARPIHGHKVHDTAVLALVESPTRSVCSSVFADRITLVTYERVRTAADYYDLDLSTRGKKKETLVGYRAGDPPSPCTRARKTSSHCSAWFRQEAAVTIHKNEPCCRISSHGCFAGA